jgi:two-component system, sensor histidine kinase and response regulator
MMAEKKTTILVVDDVPDNIAILEGILKEDYRVKAATSGEAALAIARADPPPDLILLDVMMPGMDGFEVCRRLKKEAASAKLPVIFVTARDEVSDESMGFQVGAVDYITKPVNPHIVKARIKAHLELKLAREELERQNEVLRENASLREQVEAISRHDLKNPLMVVMTVPEVLLTKASLTDKQRELLGMVEEAGRRMLEMINRTIDLYKMEKGTYVLEPSPVDVLRIIEQNKAAFRGVIEDKGLRWELSFCGKAPTEGDSFHVKGEDLLVYSLLANLIKNAIEASPKSGRISISLEERESAVVTIHNMGAIPQRIRGRFFEKFATADKERGTGLGAYSAKLITRTLGGSIGVETSDESGTTITVELPRA